MANLYWLGTAEAVAQVWTASIDSVDGTPANNTFTVTIGGVAIDAVGDTDVATTATNLRASLNASTHPYFAAVTWSGTAGDIIGTADTAGMAFLAALTETGAGTGAVTDFVATTANASPYDWGTADNWSTGTVPVNSDVVYIDKIGAKILYSLDQSAVTLTGLHVRQDAVIGLRSATFATDEAATTESAVADEYRQTYLKVELDACHIGEQVGPGAPLGSARCKIHNPQTTANVTQVFGTASTALETGAAAVRLLFDSANSDLSVRSARAGVGVAVDVPGETSTIGDIFVEDTSSVTKLYLSDGVTATSLTQFGGVNSINLAAELATVEVNGGTLTIEGDQIVTALTVDDGTVLVNNVPSGAVCVTTLHQNGGTVNFQQSSVPRTVTTYNFNLGTRSIDDHITITADNRTGRVTETVI